MKGFIDQLGGTHRIVQLRSGSALKSGGALKSLDNNQISIILHKIL